MRKLRCAALILAVCLLLTAAPAASADTAWVYVNSNTVKVYKYASTSSKSLGTMAYGEEMLGLAVKNGWVRVQNSSGAIGYCQVSALTLEDPNFSARTGYVMTDNLKVYWRASTSSSRIATLDRGDAVSIVAITRDGKWARIKSGGNYGYIAYAYISAEKPGTEIYTDVYVSRATLPVYKSKSTSSRLLGTMAYGEHMKCLDSNGDWAYVMNEAGAKGYCYAGGISTYNPNTQNETYYIKSDGVKAYWRPLTSSGAVKTYSENDAVTVVAVTPGDAAWARVKNGSSYAYVKTSSLSKTPQGDIEQGTLVYITANTLPVYKTASASSALLGTMAFGETMTSLGADGTWVDSTSDWMQVRNSAGVAGWCLKSGFSTVNPCAASKTYYIKTAGTRAYYRPLTSSSATATYSANDAVTIVGVTSDGKWARAKVGSGYGFIQTDALSETNDGTVTAFTVYVSSNTLRVYKNASSSSTLLGTMVFGDSMTCLSTSGEWAQVRNSAGAVGWCAASSLTTTDPSTAARAYYVKADGAKIYGRPDTSSTVFSTLNKGAEVSVVAVTSDANWARVRLSSGFGFIQTSLLEAEKTGATDPTAVYVSANTLPVYVSASASSTLMGTMCFGDALTCVSVSGDWAQVKNSSNQIGWCLASGLTATNPAQTAATYYVQNDGVKVYAKPDTGSTALATYNKNASVAVVAVTSDLIWARVQHSGGFAFIQTSQLKAAKVDQTDPTAVYVVANSLPVYASASTSSSLLGTMAYGDPLVCVSVSGDWAQVKNSANQLGWCKISGISSENPADAALTYYVQADGVKAYKRPDTSTSVYGTYSKNAAVTVVAVTPDGNWARVQLSGGYGFIHTTYLKADKSQTTDPYTVYVISNTLPVYSTASASSTLMGTMTYGADMVCLAVSGDWAQVKNSINQVGWCKAASLSQTSPNHAAETYFTLADGVKAYGRPDVKSYVSATYGKSTAVSCIAETPDGVWARVRLTSGAAAFIKLDQLSKSKTEEAYAAYITANTLSVYSSADTSSSVMGVMSFGEGLICMAVNGDWAKVRNTAGQIGYCKLSGISATNPNGTAQTYYAQTEGAKAYRKPDTSTGTVQTLSKNAQVSVVAITPDKTWARVAVGTGYGYMLMSALATSKLAEAYTVYVSSNTLPVYSRATTSASVMGTMNFGESMTCTAVSGDWAQVKNTAGQTGYCKKSGLTTTNPNVSAKTYYAQSDGTQAYYRPDASTTVKATYARGAQVAVVAVTGSQEWARVQISSGYAYVKTSLLGTSKPADAPSSGYTDTNKGTASASIEKVIALGVAQYGKKYVYATSGPDTYDCSGFTRYCYKTLGITLQRSAYAQGYDTKYTRITSISDLKRGDIVCFNTVDTDSDISDHTGLYLGGGKFIHASSGAGCVTVSSLTSGYYNRRFSWGLRIIN